MRWGTEAAGRRSAVMPYSTNVELPAPVQSHLPDPAQDIYREAFNHAWDEYAGDRRQEEIAHRVAWSAVKKRYTKRGDQWEPRGTRH
jgi:cation transport regulator